MGRKGNQAPSKEWPRPVTCGNPKPPVVDECPHPSPTRNTPTLQVARQGVDSELRAALLGVDNGCGSTAEELETRAFVNDMGITPKSAMRRRSPWYEQMQCVAPGDSPRYRNRYSPPDGQAGIGFPRSSSNTLLGFCQFNSRTVSGEAGVRQRNGIVNNLMFAKHSAVSFSARS